MTQNPACQIYLLTPPALENVDAFSESLDEVLAVAHVAALQVRLKDTPEQKIIETARTLLPIAYAHGTALIINDSPKIALESGADGVHLGQMDAPIKKAQDMLSKDAIIGVTCHNSKDLAFKAGSAGASYVAFGSFFKSRTKPTASLADLEVLTWWYETMEIPCVAIGGITPDNARTVIEAGADFICVSSGVWDWPQSSGGPQGAVSLLSGLCARYSPGRG